MTSLLKYAKLLKDIFNHADTLDVQATLPFAGLDIEVRSEDSNLAQWLADDFRSSKGASDATQKQSLRVCKVNSNHWVEELRSIADSGDFAVEKLDQPGRALIRTTVSDALTVDYLPGLGAAWVTDSNENRAALICSSRTPFPDGEFRAGLEDAINQHMRSNGWSLIRASSLRHEDRTVLIIDQGDKAKLGILLGLIQKGAVLVSPEAVFARAQQDSVELHACPIPLVLNVGWAIRYAPLSNLLGRPDLLSLHQSQFDTARVWKTPSEGLDGLPDQLLIRSSELAGLFSAPIPVASATVDTQVIAYFEQDAKIQPAELGLTQKAIAHNINHTYVSRSSLRLGFASSSEDDFGGQLEQALSRIASHIVSVTTAAEGDYTSLLQDAFAAS